MQTIATSTASEGTLGRLARFHEEVYAGDSRWIPPSDSERRAALTRSKFDGRRRIFQAVAGDEPLAQAVARVSPELDGASGAPLGFVGNFESRRHSAAAQVVLEEAIQWLFDEGVDTILGPVDGDIWHGYRLNLGPREAPPCLLEPYNPDYYPVFWNDVGFDVRQSFLTKYGVNVGGAAEILEAPLNEARDAGYRFESFDPDRFDREIERIWRLTLGVLRGKELFTEISLSEFRDLYEGLNKIVDPELIWFARSPEGDDVAFVFAIPNYHRAVAAMKRRPGVIGRLAFLWEGRPATAALHTIGVVPEHRGNHLSYALAQRLYGRAHSRGYEAIYGLLIDEGNRSSKLGAGLGETIRRYALYELGTDHRF